VTVPAHLVSAIAEVPYGAHPSSCYPGYAYDRSHLAEYVRAATAGDTELAGYLDRYVTGTADEETYRKVVGEERLARLRRWSISIEEWKELFR
jgi:glutaconate CoA-transferase subunit A